MKNKLLLTLSISSGVIAGIMFVFWFACVTYWLATGDWVFPEMGKDRDWTYAMFITFFGLTSLVCGNVRGLRR